MNNIIVFVMVNLTWLLITAGAFITGVMFADVVKALLKDLIATISNLFGKIFGSGGAV